MQSTPPSAPARDFALGLAPFRYADLYDPARLAALDHAFAAALHAADQPLAARFAAYRDGAALPGPAEGDLLVAVGAQLGPFVARLFGAEGALAAHHAEAAAEQTIFAFRRDFVAKRLRRAAGPSAAQVPPGPEVATPTARASGEGDPAAASAVRSREAGDAVAAMTAQLGGNGDEELRAARTALAVLQLERTLTARPAAAPAEREAARRRLTALCGRPVAEADAAAVAGALLGQLTDWHRRNMAAGARWASYHAPRARGSVQAQRDAMVRPVADDGGSATAPDLLEGRGPRRPRDGFALTDPRMSRRAVAREVDYCLICHPRAKDSCRHGLRERTGALKHDGKGVPQGGCPLDERISEAHALRRTGEVVGALAVIMVDNPMVPGTGHRICNDCMRACVFQKQDPVDIPEVETGILADVLALPYGVEIYGLLTRFNPLNRARPTALPYRGGNVLVAGLGPAGYTLAHYLLNEGHGVVGIDGLKLEPLPDALTGADGNVPRAVRNLAEVTQNLDTRRATGFGGVAEYGITVRWDKNYLTVIYLTLLRRAHFRAHGGVRLGGTCTLADAWALGFDHVAIAAGAGRPTVVPMAHNMLRGMRMASDFLMGLQLSGAFRAASLANLQVELPAVVVGGGLTAFDTATEVAAYYPVQVEKLAAMADAVGLASVLARLDPEERAIVGRLLGHAAELRAARAAGPVDVAAMVRRWGGVTVVYRRSLADSPAFRLNQEEVERALAEGIMVAEQITPEAAAADDHGHVQALHCRRADGTALVLPARAVLVAAGTAPNVTYEREHPGSLALDAAGRFFAAHRLAWAGERPRPTPVAAAEVGPSGDAGPPGFFTSHDDGEGRLVSYYGDNHPAYAGNVVKAMASAKHGYPEVARALAYRRAAPDALDFATVAGRCAASWAARVVAVNRLTPTIVEVVLHAPAQAERFLPGQFFRLQNFEAHGESLAGRPLAMEGLALTGASADPARGEIACIALEMGVSSRLCARLRAGEPVVLMGPTGSPTVIPEGETVLLCGGGLGNAVLFSVAAAMRARGNRVLYVAGYRQAADIFRREAIEDACDQVIWAVDGPATVTPRRAQDRAFAGNLVAALVAYAEGSLGPCLVPLGEVDRVLAIGSDRMMAAVHAARQGVLARHLKPGHLALASINSPMQCMMKEICAQCLQRQVDPVTGRESFVFSCFDQDQRQDAVDWQHLTGRLRQNTVLEKASSAWLDAAAARAG